MHRTAAALALVTMIAIPLRAQSAEAAVRKLDSAWARSYQTHDTVTARQIFAPDLFVTATNGSQKDREGEVADVRPYPGMTVNYFRSANQQVRCTGDACAVAGLLEWETVSNGRTNALRRRYTATYARGGPMGWQMIALHIGQAPPQ
jgi:ketosteroid isomerase-like protein